MIPVAAARQRASPVREHLELVATAHGAGVQVGVTVEAALAEWELAGCAEAFRSMLSPGQLQKLFLAAVFVRPRELLVLDEPEQRLDLRMRRRLTSRLRRETADGVAVLVATHSRDLAEQVADRVLVLESRAVPRIWVLPVRAGRPGPPRGRRLVTLGVPARTGRWCLMPTSRGTCANCGVATGPS